MMVHDYGIAWQDPGYTAVDLTDGVLSHAVNVGPQV